MKRSELKKLIRKLVKEQITLGNTPLHKKPRICSSNEWQAIISMGREEDYCLGVGITGMSPNSTTYNRCKSGSDFIYPVPTDINPDGRVGNEFCVCCEYERIPDRIDRRGTGNITRSKQRRR